MSRDWTHYDVNCLGCGNRGTLGFWFDDWNICGADWIGFRGPVTVYGPVLSQVVCQTCSTASPEITERPMLEASQAGAAALRFSSPRPGIFVGGQHPRPANDPETLAAGGSRNGRNGHRHSPRLIFSR